MLSANCGYKSVDNATLPPQAVPEIIGTILKRSKSPSNKAALSHTVRDMHQLATAVLVPLSTVPLHWLAPEAGGAEGELNRRAGPGCPVIRGLVSALKRPRQRGRTWSVRCLAFGWAESTICQHGNLHVRST